MQLVCIREGRAGYHTGDVVTVPDDVTQIDATYFKIIPGPDPASDVKARELAAAQEAQEMAEAQAKEKAELDEIARLQAQLAATHAAAAAKGSNG